MFNRRHFIVRGAAGAAVGIAGLCASPAWAQAKPPQTVLILGDSLSAEYGLRRGEGWVALLEKRLASQKISARVVNASISGETSSGGRARLPALLLEHKPQVVVIELGANDALRGLPIKGTEANLAEMSQSAQAAGAKVLLLGTQVPPNYGMDYLNRFSKIFLTAAKSTGAAVVPFFLHDVADGPNAPHLFQADRIHPLAAAHPQMLDNLWPELRKLLVK